MNPQIKQAHLAVARLLAATPKSKRDLASKLLAKGFDQDVIDQTLNDFEAKGLLSDRQLAQNIAARFTHTQPSGAKRIKFEMQRKGIPTAVRDEILSTLNGEAESERADELAQRKWETLSRLPLDKRKKKVFDFLLRRGFEFGAVQEALSKLSQTNENE